MAVDAYGTERDGEQPSDRVHAVACNGCGSLGKEVAPRSAAIEAWNRRAQHTEADGWQLVPVEMTRQMIAAGWEVGVMGMDRDGPQAVYRAMLAAAPAQPAVHPDNAAVDRFAAAMKDKLAKAREKGRSGWNDPAQCSVEFLAKLLVEHLSKGNDGTFEDVANFAMMLHQRDADPKVLAKAASPAQSEKVAHSAQWPTTPGLSARPSEVQRLREALEHCSEVMKDPWKHGEGCISRAINRADAALAAELAQSKRGGK